MYRSSRWTLIITTLPQAKSIVYEEHITSEYLASLKCVHYLKCKAFIGCSLEKSHHFNRSVCCCISLLVFVVAYRYLCVLLPRATCVCCCRALLVFVVASRYSCLLLHRATCVCCCIALLVLVVAARYLCVLLCRAICVCGCIALLVFVIASRYLCLLLHRATCVCCCIELLVCVVMSRYLCLLLQETVLNVLTEIDTMWKRNVEISR